jgi:PAS domain S-box-containing protein
LPAKAGLRVARDRRAAPAPAGSARLLTCPVERTHDEAMKNPSPDRARSPGVKQPVPPDAEQFRLLVDSVKDYAIFILTPEGRVATWNAGAQAIKGYAASEIIGESFSRFYEPDAIARGWPQHELALARSSGRFEDEGWRVRKDGSRFWASVVITALHAPDGQLRGFAKVTRDLTTRRRIEELQRAERQMNDFLAMLGHELRNPLAPMRTALEILERGPGDRNAEAYARGVLSRQLRHVVRLVDDLLDVSRITRGKIDLKLEPLDLNDIVRDSAAPMQPMIEANGQTLEIAVPDRPTPVLADETRMAQVVSNLVSNAHKYTPDGGRIAIRVHHDQDHAMLEVIDDGIGIAPHLLPLVFDPFIQGERSIDRKEGGLGIGLTLVKRLVEMHGGTVVATSRGEGLGSTFSVRLPMRRPPEQLAPGAEDDAATHAAERLRVLVVDDNDDVAGSMAMLLRMLGHEVETARDGVQAISRALATIPDVILLDIGLPRMSGYDVARALRSQPALRHTTIVACTGYGREDDRERALGSGFDRHAIKPLDVDTLSDILAFAAARKSQAGNPG